MSREPSCLVIVDIWVDLAGGGLQPAVTANPSRGQSGAPTRINPALYDFIQHNQQRENHHLHRNTAASLIAPRVKYFFQEKEPRPCLSIKQEIKQARSCMSNLWDRFHLYISGTRQRVYSADPRVTRAVTVLEHDSS